MILTVFILLSFFAIGLIIYGKNYEHDEMVLLAMAMFFILGLTLSGVGGLFGGAAGVSYKTGFTENTSFTYPINSTSVNSTSLSHTSAYTNYSSWFFGSWIAITAFFGFLGVVMGRGVWFK